MNWKLLMSRYSRSDVAREMMMMTMTLMILLAFTGALLADFFPVFDEVVVHG